MNKWALEPAGTSKCQSSLLYLFYFFNVGIAHARTHTQIEVANTQSQVFLTAGPKVEKRETSYIYLFICLSDVLCKKEHFLIEN